MSLATLMTLFITSVFLLCGFSKNSLMALVIEDSEINSWFMAILIVFCTVSAFTQNFLCFAKGIGSYTFSGLALK